MGFITVILWIVFVVAAFLLSAIVLLQEPKGGGLAEAFGGAGAEAFGVKAGGVTRLTGILAATFMVSALFIGSCRESVYEPLELPVDEDPAFSEAAGVSNDDFKEK